ncbi:hypothetical protein CIC12_03605 [Burkholderia sp. SG-MS1]|nr:hypothetical protein [Paraburkholderia sp. SG-MS1]
MALLLAVRFECGNPFRAVGVGRADANCGDLCFVEADAAKLLVSRQFRAGESGDKAFKPACFCLCVPHLFDGATHARGGVSRALSGSRAFLLSVREKSFAGMSQFVGASLQRLSDAHTFRYGTPCRRLDFTIDAKFLKQRKPFCANAFEDSDETAVALSRAHRLMEYEGIIVGTLAERLQAGSVLKSQGRQTDRLSDGLFGRSLVFVVGLRMRF